MENASTSPQRRKTQVGYGKYKYLFAQLTMQLNVLSVLFCGMVLCICTCWLFLPFYISVSFFVVICLAINLFSVFSIKDSKLSALQSVAHLHIIFFVV